MQGLRHDSVVFPKAVAPAPWTIPSHFSITSGLYPWQHGVHAQNRLVPRAGLPSTVRDLRCSGYSTALFSANAFLGSDSAFDRDFELSTVATPRELLVRRAPHSRSKPKRRGSQGGRLLGSEIIGNPVGRILRRYPFLFDVVNRTYRQVRQLSGPPVVAPWIEPAFREWLRTVPRSQPLFGMVNFLDAHEPYMTDPESTRKLTDWFREARISQRAWRYLGDSRAESRSLSQLFRRLYQRTLSTLDHRVGNLIRALKEAGRWDSTLFVLTSDHGQALLEKGFLFHGTRLDEEIARVPLTVRFPSGSHGGSTAKGWASLVDILPTIHHAAGLAVPSSCEGRDLVDMLDREREDAVYSVGDGVFDLQSATRFLPRTTLDTLNTLSAAVYRNEFKVRFHRHPDTFEVYNLENDPGETNNLWPLEEPLVRAAGQEAQRVVEIMSHTDAGRRDRSVAARLASWGYH
jgi:arylsulfatase A-like enzyme